MIDWIQNNWTDIVAIYTALVTISSIVVKLTPTLKDDTIQKSIIRFVGKYLALNR